MPPITQVSPGDLITADLMNQILTRLGQVDALLGQIGTGPLTITVPIVYGRVLSDARAILSNPALQLSLGSVLDTTGATVNPNQAASASLVVITQMPPAGMRVPPLTSVDVVVASGSGGAPPVSLPPTITSVTSNVIVNGLADIIGTNFDSLNTKNVVKFDGVSATVSPASNPVHLIVTVPTGIPGAPTTSVQAPKVGVQVTVTTPAGTAPVPGT